jgi:predicted ester cyclase
MSKLTSSLVVALGLVAFTGCKKKKEEPTTQKTVEGTPGVAKGGSAEQPATPAAEKTLTGADLAKKYQDCGALIGSNKLDQFLSDCVTDDYTAHMYGQDMKGKDAMKEMFSSMAKAMPDYKMMPQLVMVSGRNILAINLTTGTHTGELKMEGIPPIPATNKKIGMLFFHRLAINDANKATEEWGFDDPAAFMGQLGLAQKGSPPTRPATDKGLEGAPIVVVTADDDKEKANLATFAKGMEAFNAKKNADLLANMTDDVVISDQALEKDFTGKKEADAQFKLFQNGFSDGKVTASNTYAAGDWAVVIGKFDGTHDHDFMGIKKTGKKVSLDYVEVAHFKDGKIDKIWRFHSGLQLAQQIGMMPAGAAPAPAAGSAAPAPAAPTEKK